MRNNNIEAFRNYFSPVQRVPHHYERFGKIEFGPYDGNTILANGHRNGTDLLVELKHGHSRIGPGAVNLTRLARRANLFRKVVTGDPIPYAGTLEQGMTVLESLDGARNNFAELKDGEFQISHRKL